MNVEVDELFSSRRGSGKKSKSPKIESRSASEMTLGSLCDLMMIFRAGLVPDQLFSVEVGSWPESTRARMMQSGDDRPDRSASSKWRFRDVSAHGIDTWSAAIVIKSAVQLCFSDDATRYR